MLTFLRFLMLFALVVWVGGIVFFGAVMAPALFSTLPTRHLAGAVVTRSLTALHWIGLVSGVVFLVSSLLHAYLVQGALQVFSARNVLIVLMLVITLISQVGISAKMAALRADMGEIDAVQAGDPRRVEFNRLHQMSTRAEMIVLLMGIGVIALVARKLT
jgi:uncharacterized membrane protein